MSREIRAELTNMCMIYRDGRVVVQRRTPEHGWPGITFPGGHVEPGESVTQSVIREVWEETGLTLHRPRLCGVKDWMNDDGSRYIVFLYKCNEFSGELKSSEEGEVFWAERASLPGMNLSSGMEETFRVFFEDDISELSYYRENPDDGWQIVLEQRKEGPMAIPAELTNMCMLSCGGKVLVQNRVDPLWKGITFPGGHVEPGESFTEAVIREFYEETGLTIDNPVLCGVKQWMYPDGSRSISFLYQAERFEGELRPSDEGNVFWVERDNLPHMGLASGMEETLRVFLEPSLSELAYFHKSGSAGSGEWHYEDWNFQLQ